MSRKAAVVVGASSGVGRALAEALARGGCDVVVAARSQRDLDAISRDLAIRYGVKANPQVLDLSDGKIDVETFHGMCLQQLGRVDALFVPAGHVSPADDGLAEDETVATTIRVNYMNTVRIIARFARAFKHQGHGLIVGFTSVAAAVPRRRNIAYASAKAGLDVYLRGLRHYFADTPVVVQAYALGYVDSGMTFGKRMLLPPVSPHRVAAYVVGQMGRDIGVRYFPRYWRLITLLLRSLPWFLYRRLSF